MKLEIYDSVKFTLGFIFHKKNTMLVGDKLKDKSKNPFPYTTRKSYPTFPRPLKNVYKKKKKKHNYKQPDKEGPLSKKNVQSKRIVTACCLLRFAAFFHFLSPPI